MAETIDPAKPRLRAPRGYTKGALQTFNLVDADRHAIPLICVQCYLHKKSGAVLGFGLTSLHQGRLERQTMAEWRDAVTKALLAKIAARAPTKHIAVVSTARGGKYRLVFWPVLKQIALDGSVCWAEIQRADRAGYNPRSAAGIDWSFTHRNWTTGVPWIWEDERTDATILDWSPETWDGLLQIRHALDDAMAKIGELVTTPHQLTEHVQRLLGTGKQTDADLEDE